jgi:predicted nucleic acid-binding protein
VIVFIDVNIPMYVAGREHPHREPSLRFLEAVHRNEIEGCTSTEVLQEILYRYSELRRFELGREVYDLFVAICPKISMSRSRIQTGRAIS